MSSFSTLMELLKVLNQVITWFHQFSSIVTYLSVENFHSCNVWSPLNYIFSKITIVQQKSVPYAMFSASSQLSRDGLEERQLICPPGRAGKRGRKKGHVELEERQFLINHYVHGPPGKAGKSCMTVW